MNNNVNKVCSGRGRPSCPEMRGDDCTRNELVAIRSRDQKTKHGRVISFTAVGLSQTLMKIGANVVVVMSASCGW
jgi:hypothetical protein